MAANFTAASSQYLSNDAAPITAAPFTLACWFNTTTIAAGAGPIAAVCNASSTEQNRWLLYRDDDDVVFSCVVTGTEVTATAANILAVNQWYFVVARAISATNRRVAVLMRTGATSHAQNTTSRVPTGVTRIALGSEADATPSLFFDGLIGEFWYTNTDIQPGGAQLQDGLLRQLAYGGPFSVPHIAKDILEYRSLRHGLVSDDDVHGELYFGAGGIQTWTNTNVATLGPHPPLPYWYIKPTVNRQLILV